MGAFPVFPPMVMALTYHGSVSSYVPRRELSAPERYSSWGLCNMVLLELTCLPFVGKEFRGEFQIHLAL